MSESLALDTFLFQEGEYSEEMLTAALIAREQLTQLTTFNLNLKAAAILGRTWLPLVFVATISKGIRHSKRSVGNYLSHQRCLPVEHG